MNDTRVTFQSVHILMSCRHIGILRIGFRELDDHLIWPFRSRLDLHDIAMYIAFLCNELSYLTIFHPETTTCRARSVSKYIIEGRFSANPCRGSSGHEAKKSYDGRP